MPLVRFEDIALENVHVGKCWRSRRYDPTDISESAESIAAVGLPEPIIVAPTEEPGQYQLVARHRYFLAAKRLGRSTMIAGILDRPLDEADVRAIAKVESPPSRVSQADLLRLQRLTNGEGHKLPL